MEKQDSALPLLVHGGRRQGKVKVNPKPRQKRLLHGPNSSSRQKHDRLNVQTISRVSYPNMSSEKHFPKS